MTHRLVQSHHVRGDGLNAQIAVAITRGVGTMWTAYVFAAVAIAALFWNPLVWFSTAFLQLVLLPIIIVGQNVISRAQDARAEADHETLLLLHQLNETQLEILRRLDDGKH